MTRKLIDILPPTENNFSLIRLIAAAAVIVSHSWLISTGSEANEPLKSFTIFTLGQHAVNLFFILSGLMVAASLERPPSLIDYGHARILRIFPALIVCVAMTVLVLGPAITSVPLVPSTSPTRSLSSTSRRQ